MAELTSEASEMLERYLEQVRLAMSGGGPEAAAEVEQDVREHVEAALADRPGPVGPGELAGVLERLGPPDQWGSIEPPSWLARLGQRLRKGPEDWRSSYLSFAALLLGLLAAFTAPGFEYRHVWRGNYWDTEQPAVFGVLVGLAVALLLASLILARVTVATAGGRKGLAAGQRWLVLPQLAIPYACVCFYALFGLGELLVFAGVQIYDNEKGNHEPVVMRDDAGKTFSVSIPVSEYNARTHAFRRWEYAFRTGLGTWKYWLLWGLFALDAMVFWWLLMALAFRRLPALPRAALAPFLDGTDRSTWGRLARKEGVALGVLVALTAAAIVFFRM